jgi:hypothetical protein
MGGVVVTTVHEIVGHNLQELANYFSSLEKWTTYINKVNVFVDERSLGRKISDHVTLKSRDSNGKLLVANELLDFLEKLGESFDLISLLRVGDLFVVLAVTTRVFPVDI